MDRAVVSCRVCYDSRILLGLMDTLKGFFTPLYCSPLKRLTPFFRILNNFEAYDRYYFRGEKPGCRSHFDVIIMKFNWWNECWNKYLYRFKKKILFVISFIFYRVTAILED